LVLRESFVSRRSPLRVPLTPLRDTVGLALALASTRGLSRRRLSSRRLSSRRLSWCLSFSFRCC